MKATYTCIGKMQAHTRTFVTFVTSRKELPFSVCEMLPDGTLANESKYDTRRQAFDEMYNRIKPYV